MLPPPSSDGPPSPLARLVFGVAGAVLLTAAILAAVSIRSFEAGAIRADGMVVALRAGGSHPTIEFTTASGTTLRFDANGLIFGYQPGDRVHVLYGAAEPQRSAALEAAGSLWAWPMLLGTLGSSFVLAAFMRG